MRNLIIFLCFTLMIGFTIYAGEELLRWNNFDTEEYIFLFFIYGLPSLTIYFLLKDKTKLKNLSVPVFFKLVISFILDLSIAQKVFLLILIFNNSSEGYWVYLFQNQEGTSFSYLLDGIVAGVNWASVIGFLIFPKNFQNK